jgi:TolB-like protein/Tfp pilus assembly protein PilF
LLKLNGVVAEARVNVSLFSELQRRNVYRIAAAYAVAAWLIIQVVETIFPAFGFDDATTRYTVIALIIGFVPAVIFAWTFEVSPEGLHRDRGVDEHAPPNPRAHKRLDQTIIAVLVIAVTYFAIDKFVLSEYDSASSTPPDAVIPIGGSIAVMPFVDMSPGGDQAYFSDGIAEEILNLLARVPELRVVSRSSSFSYRDRNLSARDIAYELNVNYILEGSVRRQGDQLRITAQLIDALTDSHLWSGTYERAFDDIFAIQDEIAASVIPALEVELLHELPVTTETDPDAYTHYLKCRHYYLQRTSSGLEAAVEHCKQSTKLDSGYAPVWVTLASAYINQGESGQRGYIEAYELATKAIDHAIAVDPELPFAHSARAWLAFNFERDYPKSARHFRIARSLFPNSSVILANASVLAAHLGYLDDATAMVSRSITLLPSDSIAHSMRGIYLMRLGRLDEAEQDFSEALKLSPGSGYHRGNLALLRLLQGRPAEAIEYTTDLDDEPQRLSVLAMAYFDLRDRSVSDSAIDALHDRFADAFPLKVAKAHAWRGETEDAFKWLDRAVNEGHSIEGIKNDPFLSDLHADRRWQPLLESLGLSDTLTAAIEL